MREAKAEPARLLERVYRDPDKAFARLEELIKAEGWTAAAARVRFEPDQLGQLLGRGGMFASRSAQLDRSYAVSAARSLSNSLTRIVEAEQRAEREYRASVTAQIARDKVGVPKLSAEAAAVLEAVHAAASHAEQPGESWRQAERRSRLAVAQAWEAGRRNPEVAAEIDRFEQAAEQRLGEDGVAAALRNARDWTPFSVPGVAPGQRQTLIRMAQDLATVRQGRADHDVQRALETFRQREQEQQRFRQRRGPSLGR